jgi:hypothetical protein
MISGPDTLPRSLGRNFQEGPWCRSPILGSNRDRARNLPRGKHQVAVDSSAQPGLRCSWSGLLMRTDVPDVLIPATIVGSAKLLTNTQQFGVRGVLLVPRPPFLLPQRLSPHDDPVGIARVSDTRGWVGTFDRLLVERMLDSVIAKCRAPRQRRDLLSFADPSCPFLTRNFVLSWLLERNEVGRK